jgi:NAD+ kinase
MIALFAKNVKTENITPIQTLISQIEDNNFTIKFYEPFYWQVADRISLKQSVRLFSQPEELNKNEVQYLFSLGGDGTLLSAAALLFGDNERIIIPILGINFGRLGFLTSVGKNELDNLISNIRNKHYNVEMHSIIRWDTHFALNEAVLRSANAGEMLDIDVFIDEKPLTAYTADGIIVATPTGSTAYSLSCGGAILSPEAKCFCITPICPHNLTFRPLVIPDSHSITLKVKRSHSNVSFHLDSRSFAIEQAESLTLQKAENEIRLLRLHNQNFFTAISNKLMWGRNLIS